MQEYTVEMICKMRVVHTVEAESEEQAKEIAYSEVFDDEYGSSWEEIDTYDFRII